MVCQAASQTRFRALKHENGVAGCATFIVRVIGYFQPLRKCQVMEKHKLIELVDALCSKLNYFDEFGECALLSIFLRLCDGGELLDRILASTYSDDMVEAPSHVAKEKLGVLLLNLGEPNTLDDVQPFLYNLFANPDIIHLPKLFQFLHRPLAQLISVSEPLKARKGMLQVVGAHLYER